MDIPRECKKQEMSGEQQPDGKASAERTDRLAPKQMPIVQRCPQEYRPAARFLLGRDRRRRKDYRIEYPQQDKDGNIGAWAFSSGGSSLQVEEA